jgi:Asp/Glu/hydantoin racemase
MVRWLKDRLPPSKHATGILESSVACCFQLVNRLDGFGIVTTGDIWERLLTDAVGELFGFDKSTRFAGVETTGLDAIDLHDAPQEIVRQRLNEATKRLLRKKAAGGAGSVVAICLGCAGMSGMSETVREAAIEELGDSEGSKIRIVDGVQAGVAWLQGALRMAF